MNIKNNEAFSKIWIIVILVALISGGVLVWNYSKIQNNDNNDNKINEKISEDETMNWETCKNEEYKFEIKYPKDWLIEEQKGSENNLLYSLFYLDTEKEEDIYPIQIYFWENPEQIPIKQWIEKKSGRFISGINEISEITIDGYQGVKLIESGKVRLPKGGLTKGRFDKESIFISRGTLIYNLTTTVNHKYFNQMLSTLKFINPVAEYFKNVELQCEESQEENISIALNDILDLSEKELKEKKYKDYTGKDNQWDLPTLIDRHFVPDGHKLLGDNFYHDVKSVEAQNQIKIILDKYFGQN